ncbi:DUF4097 family beta strand repeat-containing protein [Roseivirga pacifica]|uniref:DUF4097 family beta strand repeat-containing protein n=1 Tax=Roseivirga pacifica TaxID=1267423 RepID=UPI002094D4AC|nr:DUF4097 family beta strand repeat-containing protein [Roseivirga pacifica]MCO6357725.1 DUF4097 family beta strand repeat protein [Roseivirga pacifica]MCO6365978.1 DUF4097 family beta strand repeat protein [Roseivirga pacifica]MCO6371306.1 DUF4097 family beta strand repeat protein [Roseivirga pacifica]MCO6375523.1 DUF4097 family beta strand repeat protein [Roseivirga pacifica]MCO6378684.1 DUF4097 family beta strand repeat protein [Roseivirga pacifica]
MHKLKLSLTALALCLFAFSSTAQERIEKSFSGIENIRLVTSSGNGTIKKSSNNEVKVTLEFTYDEEDYKPSFEQRGETLYIEEEFRRSRWTRGYSEWTLEVPDGLELDFKTGSGNIEVDGVVIELQVNSGSGNIQVDRVSGDTRANTGSGNISFRDVDGMLDANTGSGSIRLESVKGDADLNTGSGNIRANGVEGALDLNTGSGNIDIREATITGASSFNTGSGNTSVVLSAALNSDVSLNTGSGNATLDFNGQKIEGEFIMRANDESDIRAPFRFDKEYEGSGDRWGGRNRGYTKEAKIGSKNITIRISTGSGNAVVRE